MQRNGSGGMRRAGGIAIAVSILGLLFAASPALAADGTGTMSVTPTKAIASASGLGFEFTFTAPAGGMNQGKLSLLVPTGWTTPNADPSQPGGTDAICNFEPTTITPVGGGNEVTFTHISLQGGETCVIKYGFPGFGGTVTAPSTGGPYTFTAKQAATSTGTLTALSSSPVVTVAVDGTGTMAVSPKHAFAGTAGNTLTFTYTAATTITNGAIDVTAPAGWSAPSANAADPGATTSTCGTVGASGQTIEITGVNLASAGTCTIVYGSTAGGPGATAPSSGGLKAFPTKESSSASGTLTELATGSPHVSVTAADGTGSMSVTPTTAITNASGLGFEFTYTAPAGGMEEGKLSLLVPTGWTTPNADPSQPGGTDAICNFEPTTITPVGGGNEVTFTHISLQGGETCVIKYGFPGFGGTVTAPSTGGPYTFTAKQAATSTGTLTALSSSPVVNVGKAAPTIATVASANVAIGGSLKDKATLASGFNPGGQITFKLYGPNDSTCASAPAHTEIVTASGNGVYETAAFTPTTAGSYVWVASYSGDANNETASGACGDAGESASVAKLSPTIATVASANVAIGGSLKDKATLASGFNPGGQITFKLYGPNDSTCASAPAHTEIVTASGNGVYETAAFTPTTAGSYVWVASYSGDANNETASGACGDAGESASVAKLSPTIATVASANVAIGGSLKDKATLASGFNPGGQITFKLYGPNDSTCASAPAHTEIVTASGNGVYETAAFTPTTAGSYVWVASYSGDANNEAATGACGDAGESASVAKAKPTISTGASAGVTLGGSLKDKATLAAGFNPGGQITFKLYGPNDSTCASAPAHTEIVTASGNGVYETAAFTPTTAGSYVWVASYSGDANNEAATGACGDAGESASVAATCPDVSVKAAPYRPSKSLPGKVVPGVRIRLRVQVPAKLDVDAQLAYSLNGKRHTANLGTYSLRAHSVRNLRLSLPAALRSVLPLGSRAQLRVDIQATPVPPSSACTGPQSSTHKLSVPVVMVLASG